MLSAARAKQIATWKNSGSAFRRDLVRYFESLSVLELYSRGAATGAANPATPTESFQSQVMVDPPHELNFEIVVVGSGPGGARSRRRCWRKRDATCC